MTHLLPCEFYIYPLWDPDAIYQALRREKLKSLNPLNEATENDNQVTALSFMHSTCTSYSQQHKQSSFQTDARPSGVAL